MSTTDLPLWFTVKQAARHAGVSGKTVRREISAGHLQARRIGRVLRITDAELRRWMLGEPSTGGASTPSAPLTAPSSGRPPVVSSSKLSNLADGDSHKPKQGVEP